MILILFAILALAFFIIMVFMQHSKLRSILIAVSGCLMVVCAVLLTLTMSTHLGFQKVTKTATVAYSAETRVTKHGQGASYTVVVKSPSGHQTKYVNAGPDQTVILRKGNAAMLQSTVTKRRAKNGFVKFMYMYLGLDNQVISSHTEISVPDWKTVK
ncbi:DUF4811 domain-containing protein [Lacticaseibacillus hulanensis]|uniref:DUF4811 domain-containing protein n=1 Tax=Lacticaseibacillus hulanensis TaxID=2493111 RepID=UPI000FD924D0|nr:DUF4811 domain-containing protein [Lacticaseibacillus hulanensis]